MREGRERERERWSDSDGKGLRAGGGMEGEIQAGKMSQIHMVFIRE